MNAKSQKIIYHKTLIQLCFEWQRKKEKKSSGFAFKLDEGLISEINALMHCTSSTVLTNKIGLGIRG